MQGSGDLIGCGGGEGWERATSLFSWSFFGLHHHWDCLLGNVFSAGPKSRKAKHIQGESVNTRSACTISSQQSLLRNLHNLISTICTISSKQSPQSAQSHSGRIWTSRSRKANRGEERRQDRGNVCQGYSLSLLGMIVKPSCESCPTQVSWQVKFMSIMFCLSVLPVVSVLSALSVLSVISVLSFLYFLSVLSILSVLSDLSVVFFSRGIFHISFSSQQR